MKAFTSTIFSNPLLFANDCFESLSLLFPIEFVICVFESHLGTILSSAFVGEVYHRLVVNMVSVNNFSYPRFSKAKTVPSRQTL